MSPRKKPTAKTRQSTTPRKPAAPRPTKVTLARVKKILSLMVVTGSVAGAGRWERRYAPPGAVGPHGNGRL